MASWLSLLSFCSQPPGDTALDLTHVQAEILAVSVYMKPPGIFDVSMPGSDFKSLPPLQEWRYYALGQF